jgi:site-specific DNA recombinase
MKGAVSYARVSSKEQEQGYSLDSQVRTLSEYAASKGFSIVKEFKYSESAKEQGRRHFNAMLDYLRKNPNVRVVLVEKTDRLSRNLKDYVMLESLVEELGLEIHLIKEGQVLQTGSKSQDKLVQGMFALLARNYIQNLQEEILKGQVIKAEKGQYPGRARFGYAHDRQTRTIVAHPTRAEVVKLLFQLYSTGGFSVNLVVRRDWYFGKTEVAKDRM